MAMTDASARFYILQGKTPVPELDPSVWSDWFFAANRSVGDTEVGHLRVSTVFIGVNYSSSDSAPLLFETAIFDESRPDADSLYQDRCATWDEAEQIHERAVAHAHVVLGESSNPQS